MLRKFQQRSGQAALRCDGEEARPAMARGGTRARSLPRRGRDRPRGPAGEVLTVVAPPAAGLEGEDGEPGAGSLSKLEIAALARGGVGCGGPRFGGAARAGRAIPGDRGYQGHVGGDLHALMPWEAVSDDRRAAPVCEGCAHVQVPEDNIGRD